MKKKLLFWFLSVFVLITSTNAQKITIAFVEDATNYSVLQVGIKDSLVAAGYNVVAVSSQEAFDFDALDTCGLVILSRAIYSSAIDDPDAWAELTTPVLTLTPYVLGYDALNLLGGIDWSVVSGSEEGTTDAITQGTPLANDDVFDGVTSEGVDFDFYKYTYDIPYYKAADFTDNSNSGTPLVAIKEGTALGGGGAVIMARWPAGTETYPESGTTPAATRSFIDLGTGNNIENYTDASFKLLKNEVNYLTSSEPKPVANSSNAIAFVEDATNYSVLQVGIKDSLTAAGYDVIAVSSQEAFDFDALDTCGLVILSRAIYSSAIDDPDAWAELTAPVLTLTPYVLGYDALNLLGGIDWSVVSGSEEGTTDAITQGTPLANDDVFDGVTSEGVDFDFYKYTYDIPYYKAADFTDNSNSGTPLVSIKEGAALGGGGAVIMARWPAGTETYPESGTTPAATRSFIDLGTGNNIENYTDASFKLLKNEVDYLMGNLSAPTTSIQGVYRANLDLTVYPNPSRNGVFTLSLNSSELKNAQLQIYNLVGELVYSNRLESNNTTINTQLKTGLYFIKIKADGKIYTKKVIVN